MTIPVQGGALVWRHETGIDRDRIESRNNDRKRRHRAAMTAAAHPRHLFLFRIIEKTCVHALVTDCVCRT